MKATHSVARHLCARLGAEWLSSTFLTTIMLVGGLVEPLHAQSSPNPPSSVHNVTQSPKKPDAKAGKLEEIVVTAQRRTQKLQDVPLTVTALSGAQLQAQGIRTAQDLTIAAPAVVIEPASGYSGIHIRGVGNNFAGNPGLEGPITQYVDGVPLQSGLGGAALNFLDIGNVQILEGPQGSLYGRNATGGAVLIDTANPVQGSQFGHIYTEYGSYNRKQGDFVFNTPITDKLTIRVALRAEGQGDWITNDAPGGKNLGHDENYTYRVKVDWKPGDDWDVLYGAEIFSGHDSLNNLYQQTTGAPGCQTCLLFGVSPPRGFYATSENDPSSGFNGYFFNTLRITKTIDNYTFTNLASYRDQKFYSNADFDGTAANFFNYNYHGSFSTATEDLEAASHYHGLFNFSAGVFYLHDRDTANAALNGLEFGPLTPSNFATIVTDSASVFAEGYLKIYKNLTLTVGGRYNYDQKSDFDTNNADAGLVFQSAGFKTPELRSYSFTPRFSLDYKTAIGNFYIARNTGFKSGGFTVPAFNIQPTVEPEKIVSYEGGAKLRFFDDRLSVDMSVFHYHILNLQVQTTQLPAGTVTVNAAAAEATGGQFAVRTIVLRGLTASIGGTFLRANYTDYPNAVFYVPATAGGGYQVASANVTGSQIENAPKFGGVVSLNYKFDLPGGWRGDFSALGRYTTGYYFYPGGESPTAGASQPGYAVMNLTGGVTSPNGRYHFGFYGTNVTSTRYYVLLDYQTTGKLATVAAPAFYGVNFRYDF